MPDVYRRRIPWSPYSDAEPRPLGRDVVHDPRSLDYPHQPRTTGLRKAVQHVSLIGILNQLAQGSCVGHAGTKALSFGPNFAGIPAPKPTLDHAYAVALYSACERRDGGAGLPTEDEGTSGVTCGNELKARGVISGFTHTFSLDAFLDALQETVVMIGIDWHEGGDNPDVHGIVQALAGAIRGGHELCADEFVPAGSPLGGGAVRADGTPFGDGFIATEDMVGISNSWGEEYGYRGRIYMTVKDLAALLKAQGDGTILHPANVPAPAPTPPPPPAPGAASFPGSAATAAELARLAAAHGFTGPGAWVSYIEYRFPGDKP